MKRKKFIKQMKALGVERNVADAIANFFLFNKGGYRAFLDGYTSFGGPYETVTNAVRQKNGIMLRFKRKQNDQTASVQGVPK